MDVKSPTHGAQETLEEDRSGVTQYQSRCLQRGVGSRLAAGLLSPFISTRAWGRGEHVR